jgi:hypothetical protein
MYEMEGPQLAVRLRLPIARLHRLPGNTDFPVTLIAQRRRLICGADHPVTPVR